MLRQMPMILYTSADASAQSGAYRMLIRMAAEITEKGYQAIVVTPASDQDTLNQEELALNRHFDMVLPDMSAAGSMRGFLRFAGLTLVSIMRLVRLIHREDVKVVHANEIFDLYAAVAARLAGARCVWHVRAELSAWPFLRKVLPRLAVALADTVVAVSESVVYHEFHQQGLEQAKIMAIYDPGPDFAQFRPDQDGSDIRREFSLPDDVFLIVLVAKLSQRKGHETFIRAAAILAEQRADVFFLIVGDELPGEHHRRYARSMEALVKQLNLPHCLRFTGFRADIPQIMAAADIITHCSTYADPFPGVVLQGMAAGKPVIASNLGGPREQIHDGETGLLVEPGNPQILAEAIGELLDSPLIRQQLATFAAKSVRQRFTDELFLEKMDHVYRGLISPP